MTTEIKLENRTKIQDAVFLIFDTETTGNNSKGTDKPIELAAIKYNLYTGIKGKFSTLIDPEMPIHPGAKGVHGLESKDLIGAPKYQEIIKPFLEFVGDYTLVAHNIEFDLNMVPELLEDKYPKVDNLRLARLIYKIGDLGYENQELRSHKEQELRYWLNVKADTEGLPAHRAFSDVIVLAEIFKDAAIKLIQKHNIEYLDQFIEIIETPELKELMPMGKYKDFSIAEAVKKEKGNPRNYFKWMINQYEAGEMKIDIDLQYSIKHFIGIEDKKLYVELFGEEPEIKNKM